MLAEEARSAQCRSWYADMEQGSSRILMMNSAMQDCRTLMYSDVLCKQTVLAAGQSISAAQVRVSRMMECIIAIGVRGIFYRRQYNNFTPSIQTCPSPLIFVSRSIDLIA